VEKLFGIFLVNRCGMTQTAIKNFTWFLAENPCKFSQF
jgi:hypothetical protein